MQTATVDAQDRVTAYGSASYAYSPAGERRYKAVGADTTWYRYSPTGALLDVRLPDGRIVGYAIDAEGRRIGKTIDGVLVKGWLHGDDLGIVAEVGPTRTGTTNDVVSRFVFGEVEGVPEYMVRGGVTYRIVTDERGSVRLVVDATTGAVMQQLDYDPFGRVTRNTNAGFQPFGFGGGLYDEHTGLVRFGARDYDPETGTWTTKDPIGFKGGSSNLYEYGANDPLSRTDRTGLSSLSLAETEVATAESGTVAQALLRGFMQSRGAIMDLVEELDWS